MPGSNVRPDKYDPYRGTRYTYDGSAVRVAEDQEAAVRPQPRPRKNSRRRREPLTRPRVEVRQAGQVAPFAVLGFLTVAVMAVMILMSYIRLSTFSREMVKLDARMTELRSEEATLRARYELAYDLGAIESAMTADGSMSRPQPGQLVYVSLAEPDQVVLYDGEESGDDGFLESLQKLPDKFLAYFRQGDAYPLGELSRTE